MPCSVELPAGCGKTYTIAEVVRQLNDQGKRALVLTHTHCGVDALRHRIRTFGVARNGYSVRTIDSWCLDLLRSYPVMSGIRIPDEPDWTNSKAYHIAGCHLTRRSPIVKVLNASYDALIVDEYQDCQKWQHELVLSVAESLPTAVFGDRMQGLLFFGSNEPVVWERDVESSFPAVFMQIIPQRWMLTNQELGVWLLEVRSLLMHGSAIDLSAGPAQLSAPSEAVATCRRQPHHPVRTCAIIRFPNECQKMAARLAGDYSMIEEVEGRVLLTFAEVVDSGDAGSVAKATVQFAVDSAFGVAEVFTADDRKRLGDGNILAGKRASSVPEQADALNHLVTKDCSATSVRRALRSLGRLPRFRTFRREAWLGIDRALAAVESTPGLSVRAAVVLQRNRLRLTGRHPESRILARPLLVKGLEFDRAVVLDADKYNAHELYVAMTRGSVNLAVVSAKAVLQPGRPGQGWH